MKETMLRDRQQNQQWEDEFTFLEEVKIIEQFGNILYKMFSIFKETNERITSLEMAGILFLKIQGKESNKTRVIQKRSNRNLGNYNSFWKKKYI